MKTTKTKEKAPDLEWTGYASEDEVRDYMEMYNADEVGEGENAIDMEQAEVLLANDDEWYYRWKDFTQALTDMLEGGHYWRDDATNMGWQSRSGHKVFGAETGEGFLRAISPDTDCMYRIWKHGKGFRVRISHHDAPMGEHHVIMPATAKEVEDYEEDNY